MERPSLRAALSGARPLRVGWSCLPAPWVAETMARAGFEAVLLDLQHGMIDMGVAPAMLADGNTSIEVTVADADSDQVARLAAAGRLVVVRRAG